MLKCALFDANHTILGFQEEELTQSAGIDVLYGEVCQLARRRISRQTFRDVYDRGWSEGKSASFEKYKETLYEDVVSWVLKQFEVEITADDLEFVLQTYMEPLYDAAYVLPGVGSLLQRLKATVSLGLVTNYKYSAGMRGLLDRTKMSAIFDTVTISSEVGWKKPDPRIYEAALSSLSLRADEVIYVGNELEKDLWQAARMGMQTVLFMPVEHAMHDIEYADMLRGRLDLDGFVPDYTATTADELAMAIDTALMH